MAKEKGPIRRFFSWIGKVLSIFRAVFTALLTIILIAYVVVLFATLSGGKGQPQIPEAGALRLAIDGTIVDQTTYVDTFTAVTDSDRVKEYVLRDLIQAVNLAKDDSRINSLTLVLHDMQGAGISKIEELGLALTEFKATGKPVIAVSDSYSQSQYLLASYADEILLHPMGMVELLGLSSYQLYMADAIDKLGINVHIFRTGPHKSAVEPLIANEMSDESREQSQRILDDLWQTMSTGIISRRDTTAESLQQYTSELDTLMEESDRNLAELALDFKLVDGLLTRDQVLTRLQAVVGANKDNDFYEHINALAYLNIKNQAQSDDSENRVGLLVAKGAIYDGIQASGTIGGDSTAYLLRQARLNDELDALVIRVDSPGGSAFASEIIRREVELFSENDIPVFVSMGSVAASGGYWISAPADEIWATPSTITGSIGAFAALATFEDSLDKVGLNSDGVATGRLAGALRVDRPLSEAAKTIIQVRIDNLYEQFLELVSDDREISLDQLEPIAGGRVWTGNQALENGLVDRIGSLGSVIEAAAERANLGSDYDIHLIESPMSMAEKIAKWFSDQMGIRIKTNHWMTKILAPFSSRVTEATSKLELLSDPESMYLHCGLCELIEGH